MRITLLSLSFLLITVQAHIYRLPDHIQPKLYQLVFHIDPEKDSFHGTVTVTFRTDQNTNEIFLHANPEFINISSITVGPNEICDILKIDNVTEIVHISCPVNFTVENSKNVIKIQYEGYYSAESCGIFKRYYKEHGITQTVVATQMQAICARRVFPCLDEPAFKAKFDVTIFHPKTYTATGNQIKNRRIDTSKDMVAETYFSTTPLMSTYLVAFVISKFNILISNGTAVQTRKTKSSVGIALHYGPRLLSLLGHYTNISYAKMGINKMSHVAIPFFEPEAMENWGVCIYDEEYILDEGINTTVEHKQMIIQMMAHELAHQWFGNLVTMNWWNDLWLNEGFARYFEYHILTGLEDFDLESERQFVLNNIHPTLLIDSFPNNRLSNDLEETQTLDTIDGKFDEISYGKGASIIRMIRGIVGEENFKTGIQSYLSTYQFKTSDPFLLFESFPNIDNGSKHSLYVKMNTYIDKSGYPLINVRLKDTKKIEITQEEFYLNKTKEAAKSTWFVPISYTTSTEKNFDVDIKYWLEPDSSLEINIEEDAWVIVNLQQIGYFRVNYDGILWNRLIEALQGPDLNKIDVLNRASLINDIFNLARAGKVTYRKAFSLAEFLKYETEYYPWLAFFDSISFIREHTSDTDAINLLQKLALKWLKQAFPERNIEQKNVPISTLKHAIISKWKCKFEDPDCSKYALESYQIFKTTLSFSNYNERYFILCTAVASSTNQEEEEFDFLFDEYKNTESIYVRKDILRALGCSSANSERLWSEINKENSSIPPEDMAVAIESIKDCWLILKSLEKDSSQISKIVQEHIPNIVTNLANQIKNQEQLQKLKSIISFHKNSIDGELSKKLIMTAELNIEWAADHNKDIRIVLKTICENSSNNVRVIYQIIIVVLSIVMLL